MTLVSHKWRVQQHLPDIFWDMLSGGAVMVGAGLAQPPFLGHDGCGERMRRADAQPKSADASS
jgi:hypothetical protein